MVARWRRALTAGKDATPTISTSSSDRRTVTWARRHADDERGDDRRDGRSAEEGSGEGHELDQVATRGQSGEAERTAGDNRA